MENGLNKNVAKLIVHKEQLNAAVENIKNRETLIGRSLMPLGASYAEWLFNTSGFGGAKSKSTHGFLQGSVNAWDTTQRKLYTSAFTPLLSEQGVIKDKQNVSGAHDITTYSAPS